MVLLINLKHITVTCVLKMAKSIGSFLTHSVDFLAYSLCVYTHTQIWNSTNCMNFQFASTDKVILKGDNWYQILG